VSPSQFSCNVLNAIISMTSNNNNVILQYCTETAPHVTSLWKASISYKLSEFERVALGGLRLRSIYLTLCSSHSFIHTITTIRRFCSDRCLYTITGLPGTRPLADAFVPAGFLPRRGHGAGTLTSGLLPAKRTIISLRWSQALRRLATRSKKPVMRSVRIYGFVAEVSLLGSVT